MTAPDKVHLVGSIGLDSVEDVFRTVGRKLGRRLKRIPDGEPGPRRLWVSFQYPVLRASPYLRPDPSGEVLTVKPFSADSALPAEQGLVFATDSAVRIGWLYGLGMSRTP